MCWVVVLGRVGLCIIYPGTTPQDRVCLGGLAFPARFLVEAMVHPLGTPMSPIHGPSLSNDISGPSISWPAVGFLLEPNNTIGLSVVVLDVDNCWY